MRAPTLGTVLKAALVAGLVAGLTAAVFHLLVTEPVIDRAIAIEEQAAEAATDHEEPVVSRGGQKIGLVVGMLLYGLTWALLFAVVFQVAHPWLPASSTSGRGFLMALLGYWAVGLLPFLKYPASPPGVGDPETIAYRQGLYLGFLGLSVVAAVVAVALGHVLARRTGARGDRGAWLPMLALLVASGAILYWSMPGNPDEVRMPLEVVTTFRALSLAGLTLFWAVLGLLFGKLLGVPGIQTT